MMVYRSGRPSRTIPLRDAVMLLDAFEGVAEVEVDIAAAGVMKAVDNIDFKGGG